MRSQEAIPIAQAGGEGCQSLGTSTRLIVTARHGGNSRDGIPDPEGDLFLSFAVAADNLNNSHDGAIPAGNLSKKALRRALVPAAKRALEARCGATFAPDLKVLILGL
jgi:hypothetical protein